MIHISLTLMIVWLAVFNLLGSMMLMKDKQKAKQGRRRISERRLMWIAALGGAVLMWLTMILIHHKTHRKKFMIGLPVMVLVQFAIFVFMWEQSDLFFFQWKVMQEVFV